MSQEIVASATKSWTKANAFAEIARSFGWKVDVTPRSDDPEISDLIATRDEEVIHQSWTSGVWQYESSTHTIGDRTTRPRNAAGASRLLSRSPEEAKAELVKVSSNKFFRRKAASPSTSQTFATRRAALPFDLSAMDDEAAIETLTGRTVVWVNRLAGRTDEAKVSAGPFRRVVEVADGERVFQFCDHSWTGFRAFRLSDVVGVH